MSSSGLHRFELWPKTKWHDKPSNPLEEQLPDIVKGFILCAAAHKKTRLEREEWERNFEAEQRRAAQQRQEQRNQQDRAELIQKAANKHQTAHNIRLFLSQIKKSIQSGQVEPSEKLLNWLSQAHDIADTLDPLSLLDSLIDQYNEIGSNKPFPYS